MSCDIAGVGLHPRGHFKSRTFLLDIKYLPSPLRWRDAWLRTVRADAKARRGEAADDILTAGSCSVSIRPRAFGTSAPALTASSKGAEHYGTKGPGTR